MPRAETAPAARVLLLVGTLALLIQSASATWLTPSTSTPNASTVLAQQLAATGEYGAQAWPRSMPDGSEAPEPLLRAYLLPAEALYLAAAFRWLPPAVWPYLHVPITTLFVLAIAAAGLAAGGARLGLWAGILAAIDPFVIYHGPVWDDAVLAAALEWTALAALCWALGARACCAVLTTAPALGLFAAVGLVGALTRAPSQAVLSLLALIVLVHPRCREARRIGVALATGVALGVAGWGLRNQQVLGEFFVGTSHDGITLLESVSPAARPSILATGTAEGFAAAALADHYAVAATLDELDANRYFQREAWRYVAADPVGFVVTAALKISVSVLGVDLGQPWTSTRNLVAATFYAALLAGALAGSGRIRRLPASLAAFLGWTGAGLAALTLVLLSLGPVGIRYRLTITGLAYLCATASVLMSRPASPNDIATS